MGGDDFADYPPFEELLKLQGKAFAEALRPKAKEAPVRTPLDWAEMANALPPARDWAVDHWLPMGHASLLAGVGGIGKTLLAQTLGTCLALGVDYIDQVPKARRVLFWAGEDEPNELWRRQLAICKLMGEPLTGLTDKFIVESHISRDMTLAGMVFGKLEPTPLMAELREQIGDYKADFVFVDSVARVFGGSENDRHQVTTFVSWLTAACEVTGAGLCLIGHPGRSIGSEFSGSSAWEASVRSRLYLGTKLPDQRGEQAESDDGSEDRTRFLSRRKANYSALDYRKLKYADGVLVPDSPSPKPMGPAASGQFAKETVLRAIQKLKDVKVYGNTSTRSPEYLPRLAAQWKCLGDLSERQFAQAMRELVLEKRVASEKVGQYQNRTPKLGLIEVHK